MLYILNVGTVHTLCILDVGTVPTFSLSYPDYIFFTASYSSCASSFVQKLKQNIWYKIYKKYIWKCSWFKLFHNQVEIAVIFLLLNLFYTDYHLQATYQLLKDFYFLTTKPAASSSNHQDHLHSPHHWLDDLQLHQLSCYITLQHEH